MKILIFLTSLLASAASFAGCDDAYRKCVNECGSTSFLFNYETGSLISATATDFPSNCLDACRRGRRWCDGESSLSDGCDEFKRKCSNDCPSMVMSIRTGKLFLLTDAESKCDDACRSGYRRCE